MNEAAFDPSDSMLPSLGQNMASFNIFTNSVTRQSQINYLKRAEGPPATEMQTNESVQEADKSQDGEEFPEVSMYSKENK